MPSVNDFMVILIIPMLDYLVYPHLEKTMGYKVQSLHKVSGKAPIVLLWCHIKTRTHYHNNNVPSISCWGVNFPLKSTHFSSARQIGYSWCQLYISPYSWLVVWLQLPCRSWCLVSSSSTSQSHLVFPIAMVTSASCGSCPSSCSSPLLKCWSASLDWSLHTLRPHQTLGTHGYVDGEH